MVAGQESKATGQGTVTEGQIGGRNKVDPARLRAALAMASDALVAEVDPGGFWKGELSSSALSTATAVVALAQVDRERHRDFIARGLQWLAAHQNADGGWGDTLRSKSNISTTALVWAAFAAARADETFPRVVDAVRAWLAKNANSEKSGKPCEGRPDASALTAAIERRYGKDRTFSIPIVMTLALSGRLGPKGWKHVRPLPFELAALPHQFFGAMRLPVVSYALPALIAIGHVIHYHVPARNPVARLMRNLSRVRTLRVLTEIQPPNGGFLEAVPLTSFVTMSLAAMGRADHIVARRGAEFLRQSVLPDGSWPIDTNLATWVTTLAVKALARQPSWESSKMRGAIRHWLLAQQHKVEHRYTHAPPGGWAWTDLPGGVPDADDTAGALLALSKLGPIDDETRAAALAGVRWLLNLQNRDGGIPTFCRGWGALPFDRSAPDLTGHALRAWTAWLPLLPELRRHITRAIPRAIAFLMKTQRHDGSWVPLWFGNEDAPDDENPTYGTAKVLIALRELQARGFSVPDDMQHAAAESLVRSQQADGGWGGYAGGPVSVEETALAVEAFAGFRPEAAAAGVCWLMERVESGRWREAAPIGFYFAKLWYYERLYPMIFTVGALGKAAALSRAPAAAPPS